MNFSRNIVMKKANGNKKNGFRGCRLRWYCTWCGKLVGEHQSPWRYGESLYEELYPGGKHAVKYRATLTKIKTHDETCKERNK